MSGLSSTESTEALPNAPHRGHLAILVAFGCSQPEVETGHRRAVCQCGSEDVYEEPDRRVRLDPYDPSTFRYAGQCEHRYTSDPALLRAILKVRDGAGGGYWWVECDTCECGWQVPHYAESVG